MFAQFSKSLRVFPIFLATNKEMKGDLSLLHSTVKQIELMILCMSVISTVTMVLD